MTSTATLLQALLMSSIVHGAFGHAYLLEPPSRNVLAYRRGDEWTPHALQSGGPARIQARGNGIWPTRNDPGSHGLCGDPRQLSPEPASIADMQYMEASTPQRTYAAGSVVEFFIGISTHHMGHFEFRICDRALDKSLASAAEGQQCLNARTLHRAPRLQSCGDSVEGDCQHINPNHPERWYLPPPKVGTQVAGAGWSDASAAAFPPPSSATQEDSTESSPEPIHASNEMYSMRFVIPEDLHCEHCTVQWYYATGNSCAFDADYFLFDPGFEFWYGYNAPWVATCANSCCGRDGRWGEEFWNCADISVTGESPPVTTTATLPGTSTLVQSTTSTITTTTTITTSVQMTTTTPTATTTATTTITTSEQATTSTRIATSTSQQTTTPARETTTTQVGTSTTSRGTTVETLIGTTTLVQTSTTSSAARTTTTTQVGTSTPSQTTTETLIGTTTLVQTSTTSSTTSPGTNMGIQSGDTIFLKTHCGEGNMIGIEGSFVQARGQSHGSVQAITIEKNGFGGISSGDTVFLTAFTGKQLDVEGVAVQARWADKGTWQSLVVEKAGGGAIFPGDVVCFKAHTGKHIDVEDVAVRARWVDCGFWQGMRVERKEKDMLVHSGDDIYLMAHTGKHIEVEGVSVQARWTDQGMWQRLRIENKAGGAIHSGDTIFLTAHTAKMLEVQSDAVQARWTDRGGWQMFVIQTARVGAIQSGDTIFLKAHTGKFVDVEGTAVRARWFEQGLWQSLTIERRPARALQQVTEASVYAKDTEDTRFGIALGIIGGLVAVALAAGLIVAVITNRHRSGTLTSNKVHPSMECDDDCESE